MTVNTSAKDQVMGIAARGLGIIPKTVYSVVLLIVIGFCGVDIMQQLQVKREVQHWVPVTAVTSTAQVVEYRLKHGFTYHANMTLSYDYLGQHYERVSLLSRIYLYPQSSPGLAEAEQEVRSRYPVGGQVAALVNPSLPSELRLYSDRSPSPDMTDLVIIAMMLLLMAAMWLGLLDDKRVVDKTING
jgi:hypothetical protein